MRQFKFFRTNNTLDLVEMVSQEVQRIARSPEHIPAGFVPIRFAENDIISEGWSAHRNNLPPGQCPYNIGTPEREYWLTGWSAREDRESYETEDELYVEVEDVDTGECFGIPAAMSYAISYRGRMLYENSRTVSLNCPYGEYVYWIDNIYTTLDHTLVIEVTISVPNTVGRGVTFHKIRQIVPYETI